MGLWQIDNHNDIAEQKPRRREQATAD